MEKFKKIVDEVIIEHARDEAMLIISKIPEEERKQLKEYYDKNNLNVFCLHLDFLKNKLVKEHKMVQKETDNFGGKLFD